MQMEPEERQREMWIELLDHTPLVGNAFVKVSKAMVCREIIEEQHEIVHEDDDAYVVMAKPPQKEQLPFYE